MVDDRTGKSLSTTGVGISPNTSWKDQSFSESWACSKVMQVVHPGHWRWEGTAKVSTFCFCSVWASDHPKAPIA